MQVSQRQRSICQARLRISFKNTNLVILEVDLGLARSLDRHTQLALTGLARVDVERVGELGLSANHTQSGGADLNYMMIIEGNKAGLGDHEMINMPAVELSHNCP